MALTTITNSMVSVNAIQGTLIADNAITAVHIATNAVSGTLVADNAITAVHIAQNVITVTQLADDAVEADKIADGVITTNHLNSAMISSQSAVTANSSDYVLIGDASDSNALKKALVSDFGASLANDGNNRVITGTGSGLNGEANLTFDGSALQVTGTVTVGVNDTGHDVKFFGATASSYMLWDESADLLKIQHNTSPTLTISDASGNGYIKFEHSGLTPSLRAEFAAVDDGAYGKYFRWTTHSAAAQSGSQVERMRLTRAGRLGIGTTSPASELHVDGAITSNDLFLTNEGKDPNMFDGTNGSWQIQEGSDDLFIMNKLTGKKYKFKLEEI